MTEKNETLVEETAKHAVEATEEVMIEEKKPSKVKAGFASAKSWVVARKKQILTGAAVAVGVVGAGIAAVVVGSKLNEEDGAGLGDRIAEAVEDVVPGIAD